MVAVRCGDRPFPSFSFFHQTLESIIVVQVPPSLLESRRIKAKADQGPKARRSQNSPQETMKDEWDFDEQDEEEQDEFNWESQQPPASPKTSVESSGKKQSPASLSSSSSSLSTKSKASTSSYKSGIAASVARGRQEIASSASSTPSSTSAKYSSSSFSSQFSSTNRISKPGQLRTRAARLKAQGVNTSSTRKVRFELASPSLSATPPGDASTTASSAATSTTASSYRSLAESRSSSRKQRRRKRQLERSNSSSKDEDAAASHPEEKKTATKPRASVVSLQTTSVDVYAVQDVGKVQRLTDELKYCCEILHSSKKAPRQLEAVADLGQMLSNKRNRQCLLFTHHSHGDDGEEMTPLALILQLMKWLHERMGSSTTVVITEPPPQSAGQLQRTKSSRRPHTEQSSGPRTPIVQKGMSPRVVEAMGVVWHFLSTDCTVATEASGQTSSAARKLRESFLSNSHAMQALLEMIVRDPYLEPILGNETGNEEDKDVPDSAIKMHNFSQESNSSTLSSHSAQSSQDSYDSADPTVAGRRRKRRRKMLSTGQGGLDTIQEEGGAQSIVGKTTGDDSWSFTSKTSPVKTRDEGSVTSSASHVTDTEAQLEKILNKVKESVETLDNEKEELLARLPLLSLCRILSGKFEGDEKSCIDDELTESAPDDEEDEMQRNPLLRTNVLMAEKGLIPYLARATSKAAVAIVEHLTRKDAYAGRESYMRWKFCKLSALVDEACLLTDGNREAFVSEGYASETGGYLLINLTTTLSMLLEKGKLFDEAWTEVAMAALRSLTSLTHDNEIAARDLEAGLIQSATDTKRRKSLGVIALILYEAVKKDGDMANYCLNTLANVLESNASWEPFARFKVGGNKESFLPWVTKFVVAETMSFQDAVVGSTFGSAQDRHAERQLDRKEYEALMMAGYAFIFLSCILVRASTKTSNRAVDEILDELPGDERASKLHFVKNTLKAFCNLCHFSMGPLALAIVAPVKKLLSDLEATFRK